MPIVNALSLKSRPSTMGISRPRNEPGPSRISCVWPWSPPGWECEAPSCSCLCEVIVKGEKTKIQSCEKENASLSLLPQARRRGGGAGKDQAWLNKEGVREGVFWQNEEMCCLQLELDVVLEKLLSPTAVLYTTSDGVIAPDR